MTGALAEMQAWFQGTVMAADRPSPDAVGQRLAGSAAFPASAGLGIYRRAFVARIAAAMRAQFPALCHALGQPLFDDFATDYVRCYPPESYTLHDLGRRFAAFLAEQRPDRDVPVESRERWIDFMIDLARFERRVFCLYDAPGAEGRALARPDIPDDALRLQPAVALDRLDFNVAAYYHAVRREETPPAPLPGEHCVVLVRTDHVVRTVPLAAWEFAVLAAMTDGSCLADHLASSTETREARARWIGWGLFVADAAIASATR